MPLTLLFLQSQVMKTLYNSLGIWWPIEIGCHLSLYFTKAYHVLLYLAVIGIFIGSLKKMIWWGGLWELIRLSLITESLYSGETLDCSCGKGNFTLLFFLLIVFAKIQQLNTQLSSNILHVNKKKELFSWSHFNFF